MSKRRESERLAGKPHPLPVFPRGTQVSVFMGAGWAKGSVTDSSRDRCTVWLGSKSTTCSDARNLKRAS